MRAPAFHSSRVAAALWLIFAFIIWNDVFDRYVEGGMSEYIARRARYEQGLESRPTIDGVMQPAIRRGLLVASASGGATAAAGLTLIWIVSRGTRHASADRRARNRQKHGFT